MVAAIGASSTVSAGADAGSSSQLASLQKQLATAQKALVEAQKGTASKTSEQQQKLLAQQITTLQAQIAQLQANSAKKSDVQSSAQTGTSAQGGATAASDTSLGSIIDTQAGVVSPNRRKFRQPKLSPATIASRSMSCPVLRNV